jgi:hypothetical protein
MTGHLVLIDELTVTIEQDSRGIERRESQSGIIQEKIDIFTCIISKSYGEGEHFFVVFVFAFAS